MVGVLARSGLEGGEPLRACGLASASAELLGEVVGEASGLVG